MGRSAIPHLSKSRSRDVAVRLDNLVSDLHHELERKVSLFNRNHNLMDILALPTQKPRYLLVGIGVELFYVIEGLLELGGEIRSLISRLPDLDSGINLAKLRNP
jgi:hypothetical protein